MGAQRQRNTALKALIDARGWSQQFTADAVNAAVDAATGRPGLYTDESIRRLLAGRVTWPPRHYRQALQTVFNASDPGMLGLYNQRASTPQLPVAPVRTPPAHLQWDTSAHLLPEEDDVHRRDVLRLGAAMPAALAFDQFAATGAHARELLEDTTAWEPPPALTGHILDRVEAVLTATLLLDDAVGPHRALDIASAEYRTADALLSGCSDTDPLRHRLLGLRSNLARFGGWLLFNLCRYQQAAAAYEQALDDAHQAEDTTLAAITLCQASHLATWRGNGRRGVDHGVAAQQWAARTGDPRLRAYAADVTARALAATGQRRDCLELLDSLTGERGATVTPTESPAYFYDDGLAVSTLGQCLLTLGETAAAVDALTDGDSGIAEEFTRNRAFNAVDLAAAHLGSGDIDAAAAAARTAAELTATNRSPRLIATLTDVRIKMHRWDNASPVLELDTDLRRYRLPVPVANSRT
ncbi:hypothetical protein [Nocardia asiatica]|uniref:hypothetical protein n=1 Tax=Nocardia asiatica TaxID=209252 RepID=UPI00245850D8|nr:hypothetical protein [Nocardia asiatica]